MKETSRLPALDGMRGLAILLVLVWHGFASQRMSATRSAPFKSSDLMGLTGSGVDLFFVLLGFLLGNILLNCKHSPTISKPFMRAEFAGLKNGLSGSAINFSTDLAASRKHGEIGLAAALPIASWEKVSPKEVGFTFLNSRGGRFNRDPAAKQSRQKTQRCRINAADAGTWKFEFWLRRSRAQC